MASFGSNTMTANSTSGSASVAPCVPGTHYAATPTFTICKEEHLVLPKSSRDNWDDKAIKAHTLWERFRSMPKRSTMEYALETDSSTGSQLKKCHFLALPKELRLEIYEYVLTDPSTPDVYVDVRRQPSIPPFAAGPPRYSTPKAILRLRNKRATRLSINILLTNRFIYEEALPILYRSAKFAPMDHEGLLPIFLGSLKPLALSNIRTLSLLLPLSVTSASSVFPNSSSMAYFHWAMTCAQVAKMGDTLRIVEIVGYLDSFKQKHCRRMLLVPLCKIRTMKKLVWNKIYAAGPPVDEDAKFQELLQQADEEFKITARRRKGPTEADLRARRKRQEVIDRWAGDRKDETPPLPPSDLKQKMVDEEKRAACRSVLKAELVGPSCSEINNALSQVPGMNQFELELKHHTNEGAQDEAGLPMYDATVEGWDVVSMRSGSSTPRVRPKSYVSEASSEEWLDGTASTLLDGDDVGNNDKSDTESENWEDLGK